MVAKFLTFFGLVSAAVAISLPVTPISKVVYAEPETPAQYEFSYSVQDPQTGDIKDQQESRSGDAVRGLYSLVQPDGLRRIVEYSADDHQGFNAIVRYEGTPIQAAPVAKIAYAPSPITKIAYAPAPVAKVAYAAPIAKVAYNPASITYAAPAPVTYAQAPITYAQAPAPITYAQAPAPITYAQAPAPISYAAPVTKLAYSAAPIAKVAYAQNLGRVTFSSPHVSYQH